MYIPLRYFLLIFIGMLYFQVFANPFLAEKVSKPADEIYKNTYQFHFRKVDSLIHTNNNLYRDNLEFNLAVINYYWWRLISDEQNTTFSELLSQRIKKLKTQYPADQPIPDNEQLFLLISIYTYSARVSLLNYSYYAALNDLSEYYSLIKRSFGRETRYCPFYLTSGLYYYFTGYARLKMPLLAPFLHFYTPGDIEKGLLFIRKAEACSDPKITQESWYFLMKINFDINRNYKEAGKYCNQLLALYPDNLLFQLYMLRISLAVKQPEVAKSRMYILKRTAIRNPELTPGERNYYIQLAETELSAFNQREK